MTSCQIVDNMYAGHIIESKGFYFGESNCQKKKKTLLAQALRLKNRKALKIQKLFVLALLSSARFIVTFKFALFPLNFGYLSAPRTRFSETPAKDALSHVLIVY